MRVSLELNPTELREALEAYCKDRTGHELDTVFVVSAYNSSRIFVTLTPFVFEVHETVRHRLTE